MTARDKLLEFQPSPELDAKVADVLPRLAELRTRAGATQAAVAAHCGVTKSAVSRWEAGNRKPVYTAAAALAGLLASWGVDYFTLGEADR